MALLLAQGLEHLLFYPPEIIRQLLEYLLNDITGPTRTINGVSTGQVQLVVLHKTIEALRAQK